MIGRNKRIQKINSIENSIKYIETQISQQKSMINSLERIVRKHEESKAKLQKQLENFTNDKT